jgi:hypothetical protein
VRHVTAQQLSAFLDGALSGVSRELVTRHLAACADCRERHALWHIYDEVLQRVLSWEPSDHVMEEASTRVELTLTAERRGLPPPPFTSVLHSVIGSAPGAPTSPSASGLFPTLPPITPTPATATPAPRRSTPPATAPPSPVPYGGIVPSAHAYPLDPPEIAPPPIAPPPHAATPPLIVFQGAPAAPWYTPPPPVFSPPMPVHEAPRAHVEPSAVPWASLPPPPRRKHPLGRVLLVCAALLGVALLASPWLPDVIRIRLPDGWPGVGSVERSAPPTAPDPRMRLAERAASEETLVPGAALPPPVDSAAARSTSTDAAPAPARTASRSPVRPRVRPVRPEQPESEDEAGTAAGVAQSMTFVPVQVKTEVQLSPSKPASASSASPAAADTVGDQALPLLCGQVVDESGAPIEGARVQVMSPALTIRTDKHGRFCVALPAGERTFLVEATGYSAVTRGVELDGATFETHVTLAASR